MKTSRNLSFALAAALLVGTPFLAFSQSQIPAAINYQGRLTDTLGNPLGSGYYEIEFRIWDDAVQNGAGNFIWGRSFALHVVTNGLFNILLTDDGGIISSPSTPTNTLLSAFGGEDRYLGLTITVSNQVSVSNSEISPRQRLASAPFAIQAQTANRVATDGVTVNMLRDGSITTAKLTNGAVTTLKIATNAVNAARIANNAVTGDKLAIGAVSTIKIANNAVTANKITNSAITSDKISNGAVTFPKLGFQAALLDTNQTFTGQNRFVGSANPLVYVNNNGGASEAAKFEMSPVNLIIRSAATPDDLLPGVTNYAAVIENTSGTSDGMLVLNPSGGRVGIGTPAPKNALVEIVGSRQSNLNGYGYLNKTAPTGVSGAQNQNYSLYANQRIAAVEFNAFSDARIKHLIGQSDRQRDLQTLLGIEVTDYSMVDTVEYGPTVFKKVVAQQVEKVYPQAVTSNVIQVVPDIYVPTEAANGWIPLANHLEPALRAGDRVKLILEDGDRVFEITEANDDGFRVSPSVTGEVFVYGRQVDDFRTMDYDALTTLNISATQELYRRLVASEQAVAKLQTHVAEMEAREFRQQARFTALERLVHESRNGVQQASMK